MRGPAGSLTHGGLASLAEGVVGEALHEAGLAHPPRPDDDHLQLEVGRARRLFPATGLPPGERRRPSRRARPEVQPAAPHPALRQPRARLHQRRMRRRRAGAALPPRPRRHRRRRLRGRGRRGQRGRDETRPPPGPAPGSARGEREQQQERELRRRRRRRHRERRAQPRARPRSALYSAGAAAPRRSAGGGERPPAQRTAARAASPPGPGRPRLPAGAADPAPAWAHPGSGVRRAAPRLRARSPPGAGLPPALPQPPLMR